jgi:hypothetical protein
MKRNPRAAESKINRRLSTDGIGKKKTKAGRLTMIMTGEIDTHFFQFPFKLLCNEIPLTSHTLYYY